MPDDHMDRRATIRLRPLGDVMAVSKAQRIVRAILDDLEDRKYFDEWWDTIDEETQKEIIEELESIVTEELKEGTP